MIVATFLNEDQTFAVHLNHDGTVQTVWRENRSDMWNPPSEKVDLHGAIPEFTDMLKLVRERTLP